MTRILSAFCGILLLSVSVRAYSETYLGCSSIGAAYAVTEANPDATDISDCDAKCAGLNYAYAWYVASSPNYCACSSQGPAAGGRRQAESGYTDCGNDQSTVIYLNTDYDFVKCYGNPTSDDTTSQSSVAACFDHCKTYNNALFDYESNKFGCICSNGSLDSEGLYYAYKHTPASSASTVERRRRRLERMKRDEQLRLNRFCPAGLEACIVPGSEDSFECIDTSWELESCGGCLYGSYSNSTSSIGTDCSTLSGAAFGGSTCFDGRCQISACEEGFKLVDGRCQ